jgi:hypothetical protein
VTGGILALSGAGNISASAVTVDAGTTFDTSASTVLGGPTVASLANNGTVKLTDNSTNDVLNVSGAYTATNGTVNLDIMMNGSGVDQINANSYAGSTTFAFNQIGTQSIWGADQKIVNTNSLLSGSYAYTGLPPAGLFSYSLIDDGQDIYVHQEANIGALGGIAGNITLVQSTLGAVVNRPSSPFVGGLAAQVDPGYCGLGPWARMTGGTATASGVSSTTSGPAFSDSSTVDIAYVGGQFGLDLSCFNMGNSGIDMAFGVIGGFNGGSSTQAVTAPASVTMADFDQSFAGIYATIAKGDFAADIQARGDFTDYTFNNPSILLTNAALHTDRYSVSGSASYRLAAGEYNVIPTVGFSASQTTASTLTFDDTSTLKPDDSNSYIGFAGATLNKVIVLPDGATAIVPFLTATAYDDFAPNPTSVFTNSGGGTLGLETQNLGMFGELSAGINFVNVLDDSNGGPKQFNASIRADAKFSDRVHGFGVTAQARAQF